MQKRIDKERPKLEKWETFCKDLNEKPADGRVAGSIGRAPLYSQALRGTTAIAALAVAARQIS